MNEVFLWISSFFALVISIFWLQVMLLNEEKTKITTKFPSVSILIPAYNEGKTITKTIKSVLNLDYPKDKLEIIVINDSSTDNTADMVKKLQTAPDEIIEDDPYESVKEEEVDTNDKTS